MQPPPYAQLTDDSAGSLQPNGVSAYKTSYSNPMLFSTPAHVNEFDKLKLFDPSAHARVSRLELTPSERDVLAITIQKMNDHERWADKYTKRGRQLWATQALCAAGVPVLIALIGSFGSDGSRDAYGEASAGAAGASGVEEYTAERPTCGSATDFVVRMIAILLSIAGTVCRGLEDANDWKAQAGVRRRYVTRMRLLFDNFCVLSGELFDPELLYGKKGSRSRAGSGKCSSSVIQSGPVVGGIDSPLQRGAGTDGMPTQQQMLAAALEELRMQHSGGNFRRYSAAFASLDEGCAEELAKLNDPEGYHSTSTEYSA